MGERHFASFADFYPWYLTQHRDPVCRGLHVAGTVLATLSGIVLVASGHWGGLPGLPLLAYACSWTGHFVFEGNTPATFGYPGYSLLGDYRMTWESLRGLVKGRRR